MINQFEIQLQIRNINIPNEYWVKKKKKLILRNLERKNLWTPECRRDSCLKVLHGLSIHRTWMPSSGHFKNSCPPLFLIFLTCENGSLSLTGHWLRCCVMTQNHLHRQLRPQDHLQSLKNGLKESSSHSLQDKKRRRNTVSMSVLLR